MIEKELKPYLRRILDFVERYNKQDKEADVAEAAMIIELELKSKELPKCELCDFDYNDERYSKEELQTEIDSVKNYGRCCGCYEEYGEDGYPDR